MTDDEFELQRVNSGLIDKGVNERIVPPEKDWSEKEERDARWKIDTQLIPLVSMLYLLSFLDRVNIGNAKVAGLNKDIKLTPDQYNWAVSIFFFGYIIFEIPSNILMKKVGPSKWIPFIMILWGGIMMAMAGVTNHQGLYAARFFLGVAEAGLFPGVIFYLTFWYTRQESGLRLGLFFGAATIAGAFGGILAYAIIMLDGKGDLRGWQWIFILEGLFTVVFAAVTFILPNNPKESKWINERERHILVNRLIIDNGVASEVHFTWKQFFASFRDWKVYLHIVHYVGCATPLYSISVFLPSILQSLAVETVNNKSVQIWSNAKIQLMSAPPYVVACTILVILAFSGDYFKERAYHVIAPAILGMLGYILIAVHTDADYNVQYGYVFLIVTGVFGTIPNMLCWFSNNIGGVIKRGIAFIVGVSNFSGAIGGQVYQVKVGDPHPYKRGHIICACMLGISIIAASLMKYLLWRENKRRDNLTPDEYQKEVNKNEDLGDMHPGFRYIL